MVEEWRLTIDDWQLTIDRHNAKIQDIITIDFEDFRVVTREITVSQQAHIIKSSFQHFFKQILDFCQTSQFHYEKMNTILITLHKWNEDMCHNFQSETLYKTLLDNPELYTSGIIQNVASPDVYPNALRIGRASTSASSASAS